MTEAIERSQRPLEMAMPLSLGHVVDFQVHAIAEPGPLALALRQQSPRFFGGFGLHAPILDAGHLDGRVEESPFSLG